MIFTALNFAVAGSASIGSDGTVYIGSNDGNLYALTGDAGKLKWSFQTNGAIVAAPSIGANGVLFVPSTDTNIYAVADVA